jgi:hypothetical protein
MFATGMMENVQGIRGTAVVFHIPSEKGSKGLLVPKGHSAYKDEREVILPPNTKFKIESVERNKDDFSGLVVRLRRSK